MFPGTPTRAGNTTTVSAAYVTADSQLETTNAGSRNTTREPKTWDLTSAPSEKRGQSLFGEPNFPGISAGLIPAPHIKMARCARTDWGGCRWRVGTSGVPFHFPVRIPHVCHARRRLIEVGHVTWFPGSLRLFGEVESPCSWRDAKILLDDWSLAARRQPRRLTEPSSSFADVSSETNRCSQIQRQAHRRTCASECLRWDKTRGLRSYVPGRMSCHMHLIRHMRSPRTCRSP